MIGGEQGHYSKKAKDQYRVLFFKMINTALSALHTRFQSNVIEHLRNVKKCIVNSKRINTSIITDHYRSDFEHDKVRITLKYYVGYHQI